MEINTYLGTWVVVYNTWLAIDFEYLGLNFECDAKTDIKELVFQV